MAYANATSRNREYDDVVLRCRDLLLFRDSDLSWDTRHFVSTYQCHNFLSLPPPSPPVFCSLIMCYWSSSKEMYPQLDVGPENFPSSYGIEPLPFLGAEGVVASSREVQRSFPLNDYGHLEFLLYSLATILLNGWKIRLRNYRTFNGRVSRAEFNRSICAFLKDDTSIKLESVGCESPISTLLHDMISNDPTGMFRHQVDLC